MFRRLLNNKSLIKHRLFVLELREFGLVVKEVLVIMFMGGRLRTRMMDSRAPISTVVQPRSFAPPFEQLT